MWRELHLRSRRLCGLDHPLGDGTGTVRGLRSGSVRLHPRCHHPPRFRPTIHSRPIHRVRVCARGTAHGTHRGSRFRPSGHIGTVVPRIQSHRKAGCRCPARGGCDRAWMHDGVHRLRIQSISRIAMATSTASRCAVVVPFGLCCRRERFGYGVGTSGSPTTGNRAPRRSTSM